MQEGNNAVSDEGSSSVRVSVDGGLSAELRGGHNIGGLHETSSEPLDEERTEEVQVSGGERVFNSTNTGGGQRDVHNGGENDTGDRIHAGNSGGDGRYRRQQSLVSVREGLIPFKVGIIGVGNIGSHVALNLARVGVEVFNLYDSDKIELHNTTSQAYNEEDIGKYKVEALRDEIKKINKDAVVYIHSNATIRRPQWRVDNDFLVVAVDTMEMRRKLSKKIISWSDPYPNNIMKVVDVRVGGEQIDVFNTVRAFHDNTIRENPDIDPCGARFVAYISSIAGGLGAKEVIRNINDRIKQISRSPMHSYSMDVKNMFIVNEV